MDRVAWSELFTAAGAVWRHEPGGPHVVHQLDGLHAAGYFNSDVVVSTPALLGQVIARGLAPRVTNLAPDVLVAPRTAIRAGEVLVEALGRAVGVATRTWDIVRDRPEGTLDGFRRALVVTDDVHGGGSARAVVRGLGRHGLEVTEVILALADLSSGSSIDGRSVEALARFEFSKWVPEDCPLCALGSHALPAREAWARLVAGTTP